MTPEIDHQQNLGSAMEMDEQIPSVAGAEIDLQVNFDEWTYGDLKQNLLELRNRAIPEEHLDDFDADKNLMGLGDGAAIYYPRRSDKEELIDYALLKAHQLQDRSEASILLAATVVAVHPFADGNGRVSRAIYQELMGVKEAPGESERVDYANSKSREHIDMGTAFTEDPFLGSISKNYPYYLHGLERKPMGVVIHKKDVKNEIEASTLSPEAVNGLSEEEKEDLTNALGADEYGNTYRKDQEGLTFAVHLLASIYPELTKHFYKAESLQGLPGSNRELINLHEFLPAISTEQKKEFVGALWEHRKLRAQASIDFLSADIGRNIVVSKVGRMSVRSLVMQRTNNLYSSRIDSRPSDN